MKLSLAISPCPNDTFIFDALVNKKIDTEELDFDVYLEDVQTLNQWAIEGKMDISKISYGVLPLVLQHYILLNSGGALGKGVGPLLISKASIKSIEQEISGLQIAIPGKNTTAHLLFSLAFPQANNKTFMVFNQVEEAVIKGVVDAGVIIHENRFTYQQKGLVKLIDLGSYWEGKTGAPIPLGGIVIKNNFPLALQQKVDRLIKNSVEYALANYPTLTDYVKMHSQQMEENVMRQHIDLYVNNYSIDLGEEGKTAIKTLMKVYHQSHHLPQSSIEDIIIPL